MREIVTRLGPTWLALVLLLNLDRPVPPLTANIADDPVQALSHGVATYYRPGLMTKVALNRLSWRHIEDIPPNVGLVALKECEHIGRRVMIHWLAEDLVEGPFLVIDCAARHDWPFLERIRFAVDVDWNTAQRHRMRGPVPVAVYPVEEGQDHSTYAVRGGHGSPGED
ncbi:MAG: hypothetical protein Kow0047_06530 [Anaerolineae bacterium]